MLPDLVHFKQHSLCDAVLISRSVQDFKSKKLKHALTELKLHYNQ